MEGRNQLFTEGKKEKGSRWIKRLPLAMRRIYIIEFSLFVYLYFYYKKMEGRNQLFTEGKKEKGSRWIKRLPLAMRRIYIID